MITRTPRELGLYARDRRRRVLGISQSELARQIQVHRRWVERFESGAPGVDIVRVFRALGALGIIVNVGESETDSAAAARAGGSSAIDIDAIVARPRQRPRGG